MASQFTGIAFAASGTSRSETIRRWRFLLWPIESATIWTMKFVRGEFRPWLTINIETAQRDCGRAWPVAERRLRPGGTCSEEVAEPWPGAFSAACQPERIQPVTHNKYPKIHNAMWPGLVGKGPDSEPPIDLDTMLNLTAAADVDGVGFDGVDLFLFDPHVNIDSTDDDLQRIGDGRRGRTETISHASSKGLPNRAAVARNRNPSVWHRPNRFRREPIRVA